MAGAVPTVKIDNVSDPFATVLTVEFGERGTELLDSVRAYLDGRGAHIAPIDIYEHDDISSMLILQVTALKNLGLNIRRAKVGFKSGSKTENTFYITDADTSEKVIKSARLEDIRMTVMNSLMAQFPVSPAAWEPLQGALMQSSPGAFCLSCA